MSASEWEIRPGESAKAFEAFTVYRGLRPSERSLRLVGEQLGKSEGLIERWSARWAWVARVRAYDAHLEQQRRADWEAERLEQRAARQKVVCALLSMAADLVRAQQEKPLTPDDLHRLASAVAKVLADSRAEFNDLPTQRSETAGPDGGALTVRVVYDDAPPRVPDEDDALQGDS